LGGQIRYMAFSHKPRGVGRQEFQVCWYRAGFHNNQ